MKIKLSKSQWEFMGRKAGWIKKAFGYYFIEDEKSYQNLLNILLGEKLPFNITKKNSGEIVVPEKTKMTKDLIRALLKEWPNVDIPDARIKGLIGDQILK
jgi:hypothetical protein